MTEPAVVAVDPNRDVFVTPYDVRLNYVHGRRRTRSIKGAIWNVFHGKELIEQFEAFDEAIRLARKVAMRTGRPKWISADGNTFEAIE